MQSQSLLCWLGMAMRSGIPACRQRRVVDPVTPKEGLARTIRLWASDRRDISTWSTPFVLSLFVFTGCTAYVPPPLTTQHPAHPEATAAPALPPSTTLAYGPSDIPSPQPAISMAQREISSAMQHGGHGTQVSAQGSQHTVVGEGTVIAVVPRSSQIVVDHKEIPGFMEAMTMGYRIEPPSLLETVKAGDTIRFTIDTQQKAIVKIEKLK
jgi:Cu/Ag efflux protein CusF